MRNSIEYIPVWGQMTRLCHWGLAFGVLFQLFSAFALTHGNIDYDFWYDWHQMIGQSLLLLLGLRIVLMFTPGSSHWRSLLPTRQRMKGWADMVLFYLSLARAPLPNWYAHNPFWLPLYSLILLVLIATCVTGMMQAGYPGLHAGLASLIAIFSLFHIITALLHDWKGKGGYISAMLSGSRYFHHENSIQNSIGQGTEIHISADTIKRRTDKHD